MDVLAELLAALVETCEQHGLAFPLIVSVVCGDSKLFCLRVTSEDDVDLVHCDQHIVSAPLPVMIYVTDKAGASVRGRIAAEDPDTLLVLH
jgi:hypothetical protein